MGYLKRKLRRRVAAEEALRFERSAVGGVPVNAPAPRDVGYIRLAVDGVGVFQAAYGLAGDPQLNVAVRKELAAYLRWSRPS